MRFPIRAVLWTAVGLIVLVAVSFSGLMWLVQKPPDFYEQALAIDRAAQTAASDELESSATALYNDVHNLDDWQVLLTAEQINGYLAVDLETMHPGLLPEGVGRPRVLIEPHRLAVAFQMDLGPLPCVYSVEADVYLSEPNVVACRILSAKAGALPLPLKKVLDQITAAGRQLNIPLRWVQVEGDPVALLTISPNLEDGDRQLILETLELHDGELFVAGGAERRESPAQSASRAELNRR